MTTENETEPHDVAQDVTKGELETALGKFKYAVYHDNVYFSTESTFINRVEYRITFRLYYVDGKWAYTPSSNNGYLEVRRKDWTKYSHSAGSDAAYNKIKETLIPFLCKWMDANPALLQVARKAYLQECQESIKEHLHFLHEQKEENTQDLHVIQGIIYSFDAGDEVDWQEVKSIDGKERKH